MMRHIVSLYVPSYPTVLVYMLQSTEYQVKPYLQWHRRTKDFSKVMYRRNLHKTKAAKLLLLALSIGMLLEVTAGLVLVWFGYTQEQVILTFAGLVLIVAYPLAWAYLVTVPLILGRLFIVRPREKHLVHASETIFKKHPGVKIAVAGSYGKTSMKELLNTVLSQAKTVAATPANKNVSVSHAYFAQKLTGNEDVLIIEYGEGAPGDVERFAAITHPDLGIITGLAPAHLDQYPSLQAAGEDIFTLADAVGADNTFVNGDSEAAKDFIKPDFQVYTSSGVMGWKVSDIKVGFTGTSFIMKKGKHTLKLGSGLMGEHQVGPLALAAALAHSLGLTEQQIKDGIAATQPFEHRMQPRATHGAWIIDDTYNGNIDGLKAGLKLLQALPGKRKIYVTPGLVDQGEETERVHVELGHAIAQTNPDIVVLMDNSATPFIRTGLEAGKYTGQLQIQFDPLDYYTNLDHFVAAGDVVLLQNDWTDNYN